MPNFVSIKKPAVILESFKDFPQFPVLDPCHNAPETTPPVIDTLLIEQQAIILPR